MLDLNNVPALPAPAPTGPTWQDVDDGLRERVQPLVELIRPDLKRNPAMSTRNVARYGSKGGFKVDVDGPTMGRITAWSDGHDKGMSPLQFIQEEMGLDRKGAFQWALSWLGYDLPDAADLPAPAPKPEPKPEQIAQQAVQEAAEAKRNRCDVDWILRRTGAAEETPVQVYLSSRGINAIPPCIGWNATEGAMIAMATDESGYVHALQMIYLSQDGKKDPRGRNNRSDPNGIVKRTRKAKNGWNTVSAMRCPVRPGVRDDVVVVAEGPETALSIWQATGLETWAVFGISNVAKSPIPAGKRVVIALDLGAERLVGKAAGILGARGFKVMVARPAAYQDKPKADFNDMLVREGAEAVSRAVFRALEGEVRPYYAKPSLSVKMAAAALDAAITCYFGEILAPAPCNGINLNSPIQRVGIRAQAGMGKSEVTLDQLARPEVVGRYASYYVPSHRLSSDLAARFNAKSTANGGPRAIIIRGRDQQTDDGRPMCVKADIAQAVAQLGQSVKLRCCHRPATEATDEEFCEHYHQCPYIAQMADSAPAVRILPHSYLFQHGLPRHLQAEINVIDESFWQASLRGVDGKVSVPLERITHAPYTGKRERNRADAQGDGARLSWMSERLASVLATINPTPAALRAAGITAADAAFAKAMWYGEVEDLEITPAMPRSRQQQRLEAYRAQECLKLARLWTLVEAEIDLDRAELRSIRLERGAVSSDGHFYDRVTMCWSADLTIADDSHILLIDADFEADIARRFVPDISPRLAIEVERQNLTVTQIVDRAVGKTLIADTDGDTDNAKAARKNVAKLHGFLTAEAAKADNGALLVTYKATEDELAKLPAIPGAEIAHFNAIRGIDSWRDVSTLIVAGRTQPDPATMETIARALYFRDPRSLTYTGTYTPELRGIRMDNGDVVAVSVDHHPDSTIDRLLRQIRESELVQAIDRGRFVHRAADNPGRVVILTNTVLPITVHEVTTWDALMPDVLDKLAASVAVPLSDSELARCFPGIWKDAKAVESWKRYSGFNTRNSLIERLIEVSGYFLPVEYRRPGQRGKNTPALVDSRAPDRRAALESVVGLTGLYLESARAIGSYTGLGWNPAGPDSIMVQLPT